MHWEDFNRNPAQLFAGMGRHGQGPQSTEPCPRNRSGTRGCSGLSGILREAPAPAKPTHTLCVPLESCTNTPCPQAVALPPSTPPAGHCCLPCSCHSCLQRNPEGTNVLCVTYSQNISLLWPSLIPLLSTVYQVLEQQEPRAQEASWIQERNFFL